MSATRVDITCPHCRRVYRLSVDMDRLANAHTTARCGRCGKRFSLRKRVHDSGVVATPLVQAARESGPPFPSDPARTSEPPRRSSIPARSSPPRASKPVRRSRPARIRRTSTLPPPTSPPPPTSGAPPASSPPPSSEPGATRYVPTDPPPPVDGRRTAPPPRRGRDTEQGEHVPREPPPESPPTSAWADVEHASPPSRPRPEGSAGRRLDPLPRRNRVTAPRRRSHSLESLPFEVDDQPRELPSIAEPLSPIDRRRRRPQLPSDPPPEPQPVASLRRTRTEPQMARVTPTPPPSASRTAITEPAMHQVTEEIDGGRTMPETPLFAEPDRSSEPRGPIALDGERQPVGGDVGPGWVPLDHGYAEELTPAPSDGGNGGGISPDEWVDLADPDLGALSNASDEAAEALRWLLVDDRVR